MKKLTVAALAVTTLLSGSAFAHEAGEFFMRAQVLQPYVQQKVLVVR